MNASGLKKLLRAAVAFNAAKSSAKKKPPKAKRTAARGARSKR